MHTSAGSSPRRRLPHAIYSFRHALRVTRFETPGHRRKRLEASKLNDAAALSVLPPEILSHIFLFCVCGSSGEGDGLDWLPITRVTRRWRQVALNCPELWANIIFRRKLVPIMLARAKMVPLVIRVVLEEKDKPYQSQAIRDNISRVGELAVSGSEAALETFFPDYVGKLFAPQLRSLSVTNTSSSYEAMWLDAMVFHGPEGRTTHPSRQLHLEKCAIPWDSPWYYNLTDLHLANLHSTQGPAITVLFSIIIASPLLQNLTLINTHTHVDRSERFFPTTLSHLTTLHISEPIFVCVEILMNLTFPAIVTNVIRCFPSPKEKDLWLIPNLVSHHDFSEMYHYIRIEAPTNSFLRVKAGGYWTEKTFDIQIDHQIPQILLEPVLQSLVTYSPTSFRSVTSLSIDMPFLGGNAWGHLCQCTNLEILQLRDSDCNALLGLLLERAFRCIGVSVRADSESVPSQLDRQGVCSQLFPNLECIILQDINCGVLAHYPSLTDILRALLWARRAGRCPIPSVQFDRCKNVFKQDLDYLTYLTDSFIWDGAQNTEEKEDTGLDLRSYSLNVYELMMKDWGLCSI
ncbi:hypothetical protein C8F04DRAFT_726595 [Mycena alexandri]|uniref:F-box domain-containing protein n=1 Tax=Mycena alexandri TaxID=1745969 RepID=A0AAD6TBT8_9AGAR|nr:hypothetical protein C8F04DRAFT_726595 [Mycena alexandri]